MTKIINFDINEQLVADNNVHLSNMIKANLFEVDESVFKILDINNDRIFFEPTLFHSLVLGKEKEVTALPVMQSLWGYIANDLKPASISVVSDDNGVINLPNHGYYQYLPNQELRIHWNIAKSQASFTSKLGKKLNLTFQPELFIEDSSIKICRSIPGLLAPPHNVHYNNKLSDTVQNFTVPLNRAWRIMKNLVPEYCSLLEATVREICLFDSNNDFSKAAFGYYGTGFLNIQGQLHDEVFFIDDIAHQCGHVLFYCLTIPFGDFFKVSYNTPLKDFVEIDWEARDIYGGFHGLFTYSTILYCLSSCLDAGIFHGKQLHETMGRLCFYMDKFRKDIAHMNDPRILTEKGFLYFDMFKSNYDFLYEKYKHFVRKADFSNQNYLFNYSLFERANPISIFV